MLTVGNMFIVAQSTDKMHKLLAVETVLDDLTYIRLSASVALRFYGDLIQSFAVLNLCGWLEICKSRKSLVPRKLKSTWYAQVCVDHPTMPDTHSWSVNSTHTVPVTTGVYTTLLEWGRGQGSEKVGGD